MRIISVFVFVAVLAVASTSFGQTVETVGTRAEGMGGAFVAVADDATAAYWNPAGIATGVTFDAQVSASPDTRFIGASLPVLGVAYYRLETGLPTVSGLPDRHNEGSESVPIRVLTTTNVGATVVQSVVPWLVIGTTARLVRGSVDAGEVRSLIDFDAGVMVSGGPVRVGFTGRNLRQPEFGAAGSPVVLERQFRVGAAWVPRSLSSGVQGPWSLAVDVELTKVRDVVGDRRWAALGGEYWLFAGRVGVRSGFRWNTVAPDSYHAVSVGFTAKTPWSLFIDAQLTEPNGARKRNWSVATRLTF